MHFSWHIIVYNFVLTLFYYCIDTWCVKKIMNGFADVLQGSLQRHNQKFNGLLLFSKIVI